MSRSAHGTLVGIFLITSAAALSFSQGLVEPLPSLGPDSPFFLFRRPHPISLIKMGVALALCSLIPPVSWVRDVGGAAGTGLAAFGLAPFGQIEWRAMGGVWFGAWCFCATVFVFHAVRESRRRKRWAALVRDDAEHPFA